MITHLLMSAGQGNYLKPTDVLGVNTWTGDNTNGRAITSGVDLSGDGGLVIVKSTSASTAPIWVNTLRGALYDLESSSKADYAYNSDTVSAFNSDGFSVSNDTETNYSGYSYVGYSIKQQSGFFDMQTWTGNGSNRTIDHNLGVKPELMIVKCTSDDGVNTQDWVVWSQSFVELPEYARDDLVLLNSTSAVVTPRRDAFAHGSVGTEGPQSTYFHIGQAPETNASGFGYIGFLFASRQGLSKVGYYRGNGTTQDIDCGFGNGARFVMVKRLDATSNWSVFDVERGISSGSDGRFSMNLTSAQTSADHVDTVSSGFTVNYVADDSNDVNVDSAVYLFFAIA